MRVEWNESGELIIESRTGKSIKVREVVDLEKGNDEMGLEVIEWNNNGVDNEFIMGCDVGVSDSVVVHRIAKNGLVSNFRKKNDSGCPFCDNYREPCKLGCYD